MTAPLTLGRVVATPGALKLLLEAGGHPFDYLARHWRLGRPLCL